MNEEFFNIALPKWPMLFVKGPSVTEAQAAEIIFRTCGNYIHTNDRAFSKKLAELFEIELSNSSVSIDGPLAEKLRHPNIETEYGYTSDLEYLGNHRIASSWIGGPYGWCDWNGSIFCNNYNVGKWPEIKMIYAEWVAIASMFNFLELSAQLFSGENCEVEDGSAVPVIQFDIKHGQVTMRKPDMTLSTGYDRDDPVERFFTSMQLGGDDREHPSFEFIEKKYKLAMERIDNPSLI